jgi:hypothetical protein
MPPLTVTADEIDRIADVLGAAIDEVTAGDVASAPRGEGRDEPGGQDSA